MANEAQIESAVGVPAMVITVALPAALAENQYNCLWRCDNCLFPLRTKPYTMMEQHKQTNRRYGVGPSTAARGPRSTGDRADLGALGLATAHGFAGSSTT
jgi:hypothetical protein